MTKRNKNPRRSDITAIEILKAPAKDRGAGWGARHDAAIRSPRGIERGLVFLLVGWATYADEHHEKHGSAIGDDYVLGPEWGGIGESLLALLNGDFGSRLDGGTLDAAIRAIMENDDMEPEE